MKWNLIFSLVGFLVTGCATEMHETSTPKKRMALAAFHSICLESGGQIEGEGCKISEANGKIFEQAAQRGVTGDGPRRGWDYGNFCGAGNMSAGPDDPTPPVDKLDACCKAHDDCLATPADAPKFGLCQAALCACALAAPTTDENRTVRSDLLIYACVSAPVANTCFSKAIISIGVVVYYATECLQ